ncbi:MAG: rRNA maturation RNase YbeY [Anaerolineales bacterium]|nr:rRNA maturation RNase YbeY [Anaerolineales bacterium]
MKITKPKIEITSDKNFLIDKTILKKIINQLIEKIEKSFGSIEICFLSDNQLHELNKKHLNHDTLTDILTFTYNNTEPYSLEILISYERAYENSKKFKVPYQSEIIRLIAHGLLHSIGYNDKTKAQKLKMRKAENDLLKSVNKLDFIKKMKQGA